MPDHTIDKQQLHDTLLTALQALVENARNAMLRAYETATHEENIAENKYDTLGLEAAYLTQGQARRLAECEADLLAFQNLTPRTFSATDVINVGAVVQLEDETGQVNFFYLGPAAGGVKINCAGQDMVVITPSSPLGQALLHRKVGDDVMLPIANRKKHYEVIALY